MEDLAKYYTANMTEAEKSALVKFQSRINEAGEIEPEKTAIQTAPILAWDYRSDIPIDEYHNGETAFYGKKYKSILSSGKLNACTTPLHLKRYMDKATENSETLNTGSAFHSLILEPEKFEYELFDDTQIIAELHAEGYTNAKATKKYKEWFSQFTNVNGELRDNVLKKDAFQTMWKLKKKLMADEAVKTLFKGSMNEVSIFLKFEKKLKSGSFLSAKVRPDGLKMAGKKEEEVFGKYGVKDGDLIIISVKTTIDASPAGFLKQCIILGYNTTEAFYYDMVTRWATEIKILNSPNRVHTFFLTLEKEQNQFTGHYLIRPATDDFIQWGRSDYSKKLETYINSTDLSEGYEAVNEGLTICEIDKPKYMS